MRGALDTGKVVKENFDLLKVEARDLKEKNTKLEKEKNKFPRAMDHYLKRLTIKSQLNMRTSRKWRRSNLRPNKWVWTLLNSAKEWRLKGTRASMKAREI